MTKGTVSLPTNELAYLLAFVGDPRGAAVLDLGCTPEVAGYVTAGGGRYVGLATDDGLLTATKQAIDGDGEVRPEDLHRWSGHDLGTFDAVVCRGVLLRVRNLARLLETVHHHIAPGGRLVFADAHPIRTGGTAEGYFAEHTRHRTFGTYFRELRLCGFHVVEFAEGGGGSPEWMVVRCLRTP